MIQYDTAEYAESRVVDTILKTPRGKLSICRERLGSTFFFSNGEECHFKNLDTSPIQLGYYFMEGPPAFLYRQPKRRDWRQGLRYQNTYVSSLKGERRGFFSNNNLLHAFNDTNLVLGDSKIFHNRKVLVHKGNVFYRGFKVGTCDGNNVVLNKQMKFLKEIFMENGYAA